MSQHLVVLSLALLGGGLACNDLPVEKLVAISGLPGAGGKSICLLLDKLGVPCVTGTAECKKASKDACIRSDNDRPSKCSSPQLDFSMPHPKLEVAHAKSLCYPFDPSFRPHQDLLDAVSGRLAAVAARPTLCRKIVSRGHCPKHAAFKSPANLALIPALEAASGGKMSYILVVREPRGSSTSSSQRSFFTVYGPSLLRKTGALDRHKAQEVGEERQRALFWSAANTQAAECAQKAFGDRLLVVRIEEFLDASRQRRRAAVERLRDFFGIRWKDYEAWSKSNVDVDSMLDMFETDWHARTAAGGQAAQGRAHPDAIKGVDEAAKHGAAVFGYEGRGAHGGSTVVAPVKLHKAGKASVKVHT